jgi:endonuclease G
MVILTRQAAFFASGLLRGTAALASTGLLLMGSVPAAAQSPPALMPVQRASCPLQPTIPVAGRKDGLFTLQIDLASMTASNMASFIVLGKEAAAAGRLRDAEVAFLMSCRLADKLKGDDSVESANAKYQLGWLYARLALEGGAGASPKRAELRRRAEGLYAGSLRTYQARLGPSHEKTRFAAEGLAALQPPRSPVPQSTENIPSKPSPQDCLILLPMSRLPILALPMAALASTAVLAGNACPQHYASGQPPVITNPKLQPRTQELCFQAFAVLHSGLSRTPLYAAEHLTRKNMQNAAKLSRFKSFHAEDDLLERDRAELSDYERSGYNRGHMASDFNFATRKGQAESFSLANVVPQVHENNVGVWAGIESAARHLASAEGEIYVLSGPAFIGGSLKKIGNVLVPTHLWKVIYSPAQQRTGAYLITNDDTRDYAVLSVSKLEKMVGLSLLPGLPPQVRDTAMALPKPVSRHEQKIKPEDEFMLRDFTSLVMDALNRAAKH